MKSPDADVAPSVAEDGLSFARRAAQEEKQSSLPRRVRPCLASSRAQPRIELGDDLYADPPRFVSFKAAARIIGISLPTLKRMIARGELPKPVSISARRKGLIRSELDDWAAQRAAARG